MNYDEQRRLLCLAAELRANLEHEHLREAARLLRKAIHYGELSTREQATVRFDMDAWEARDAEFRRTEERPQ